MVQTNQYMSERHIEFYNYADTEEKKLLDKWVHASSVNDRNFKIATTAEFNKNEWIAAQQFAIWKNEFAASTSQSYSAFEMSCRKIVQKKLNKLEAVFQKQIAQLGNKIASWSPEYKVHYNYLKALYNDKCQNVVSKEYNHKLAQFKIDAFHQYNKKLTDITQAHAQKQGVFVRNTQNKYYGMHKNLHDSFFAEQKVLNASLMQKMPSDLKLQLTMATVHTAADKLSKTVTNIVN